LINERTIHSTSPCGNALIIHSNILRRVRVRLPTKLRLPPQRSRRIQLIHHDLHKLYFPCTREPLIPQQPIQLVLRLHRIRFPRLLHPRLRLEQLQQARPVPILDIVVPARAAVQVALDRVARVVEHEQDRLEPVPDHGRDLLHGELERAVPYEKDRTSQAEVARGEGGTERGADGPADASPEDLREELGFGWEGHFEHPEGACAGFGEDDVSRAEEGADARPEPVVGDCWGGVGGKGEGEVGDGLTEGDRGEGRKAGCERGEEAFHGDARVDSIADARVVRVKLEERKCELRIRTFEGKE
jgi:hypothetical protein